MALSHREYLHLCMDEIRNKVKESGLIQIDLAQYKPRKLTVGIDLSVCLWQGLVLKEKDFRAWVKDHDWNQYTDQAVYIYCSTDAIIPGWAYMVLSSELIKRQVTHIIGSEHDLKKELIRENILQIDTDEFIDSRVIIKGCSDISDPDFAMNELMKRIQPVVKSLMFGEPCSTVPIFKKK